MDKILAVAEMEASTKKSAPEALSVEGLMMETAMTAVGVSSDADDAENELNTRIAEMLRIEKEGLKGGNGEADPFAAVMYAFKKVIPQVMTYQEAVLEETADQFNEINALNKDLAAMQGNFGASGETTPAVNGNGEEGNILGMEQAQAYFAKADEIYNKGSWANLGKVGETIGENLKEIINDKNTDAPAFGSYTAAEPKDHNCANSNYKCGLWSYIRDSSGNDFEQVFWCQSYGAQPQNGNGSYCATKDMNGNVTQGCTGVDVGGKKHKQEGADKDTRLTATHDYWQAANLFNGIRGAKEYVAGADSDRGHGYGGLIQQPTGSSSLNDKGESQAFRFVRDYGSFVNRMDNCNTVISIALNGISKEKTAEFNFKIEEYGQYLSLSSQLYDSGLKGIEIHLKEQRG